MDDRDGVRLWLEMGHWTAERYAQRAISNVGRNGVERITWWENSVPSRRDLPRVLPEFTRLGVWELGAGSEWPEPDVDLVGYPYVRTPRPGQGLLTGRPTTGLSLVLISPNDPEQAQALRDWGDFVHIRYIAEASVPGMTMITPYQHAHDGDPRFLHLYEIDDPNPEDVFRRMTPMVTERIGAPETPEWKTWAMHEALRIMYVNTFRLIGSTTS